MTVPRRRRTLCYVAACASLHLLYAWPLQAADRRHVEPIRINARNVELDEKTGIAVYRGDVAVIQGELRLQADRLEVRMRDNRTEFVLATGHPAQLRQHPPDEADILISAQRIEYDPQKRRVVATGEVEMRQGQNILRGSVVHYDLEDKNFMAESGANVDDRVTSVLYPRAADAKETADP